MNIQLENESVGKDEISPQELTCEIATETENTILGQSKKRTL